MSLADSIIANFGVPSPGAVNDKLIAYFKTTKTGNGSPVGAVVGPGFYWDLTNYTLYTNPNTDNTSWVVFGNGTYASKTPADPSGLVNPPLYSLMSPEAAKAAFGGTTYRSTLGGGYGAVIAIRYDDSPAGDYSTIWPLHTARQLPAGFACVDGWLGLTGKLTASQMVAMANSGMEILSHSHSHGVSPASDAEWVTETSAAAAGLRAAALAVANPQGFNQDLFVDGFIQPGTWVTEPANLRTYADLDHPWWQWIRSHFSDSEGYLPQMIRGTASTTTLVGPYALPAVLHHGTTHVSFAPGTLPSEYATWDLYGMALVDQVVAWGGRLEILVHYTSLDQGGMMTTAQWTTILDYIKTQRDNDLLDVLTPSAAHWAQPSPQRPNLCDDPTWDSSVTGTLNKAWNATGSPTVQTSLGYSGANALDVDSANYARQKHVIGTLFEPECRTLCLRGWYQNAVAGAASSPRILLHFEDATNLYVSTDFRPAASDAWTQFHALIRPPRFPSGAGGKLASDAMNLTVWPGSLTAGNRVRYSDLELFKV